MMLLPPAPTSESAHRDPAVGDHPVSRAASSAPRLRRFDWVRWVTFDPFAQSGRRFARGREWLPQVEDEWEGRIKDYLIASAGREPRSPTEDVERFLAWLADSSPQVVGGRIAHGAGEEWSPADRAALRQRLAHARFQRRWRAGLRHLPQLSPRSRLIATLNPIHVWATMAESRPEEEADAAETDVLFFPVGEEVRAVRLGLDAAMLLRRLEPRGRTVRRLVRSVPDLTPAEGLELLRDLCQAGAIAIG